MKFILIVFFFRYYKCDPVPLSYRPTARPIDDISTPKHPLTHPLTHPPLPETAMKLVLSQ